MTYDLENVLFDVSELIKSKFNTEIGLVNTEKSDEITLNDIPDSAYFIASMDDKVANKKDFVFIDYDELQPVGLGPATSESFAIIILIVSVQINKIESVKRMLRYGRALKQVVQKNWRSLPSEIGTVKVESIPIQDIFLLNSTAQHKTIGLRIRGAIA